MFDLDNWNEIYLALTANKLRTALTAFGVFWGLFMLMVMLGAGNGLQNGVAADFGETTNSVFVWARRTSIPYRGLPVGRRLEITNDDGVAIRKSVGEVAVLAPRNQLGGYRGGNNVTRGSKAGTFNVMGDHPEIRSIRDVVMTDGRFLNRFDLDERRKVAVIGNRVREVLFGDTPILGGSIRINGVYFKIIGAFDSIESGDDGQKDLETIYIPLTTFQRAFNYGDRVGWFAMTSADGVSASVAERKVKELLARRHKVSPDDTRAFGSFNLQERYLRIIGLFGGIQLLVWIVGIGTLAAGVIGVSNIMLVIVRERTKEIGIRRAVGARPSSIVGQVILEAIVLTSIAGYFGLVGGVAVIELVAYMTAAQGGMFQNPGVSLTNAAQALAILIVAGILAGVIPAQRAVRVHPVEALRAE